LSKTAGITSCSQHPVVLYKAGEPHRCYLDLRPSLQRILTPLGLPKEHRHSQLVNVQAAKP
jgi:hypothetical protein